MKVSFCTNLPYKGLFYKRRITTNQLKWLCVWQFSVALPVKLFKIVECTLMASWKAEMLVTWMWLSNLGKGGGEGSFIRINNMAYVYPIEAKAVLFSTIFSCTMHHFCKVHTLNFSFPLFHWYVCVREIEMTSAMCVSVGCISFPQQFERVWYLDMGIREV